MRVEDYCPYLDDHGSTMPASLTNHAAAVCSVVRHPAATASDTRRALATPGTVLGSSADNVGQVHCKHVVPESSSSSSSSSEVSTPVPPDAVGSTSADATTLQETTGEGTTPPPPCPHAAAREHHRRQLRVRILESRLQEGSGQGLQTPCIYFKLKNII